MELRSLFTPKALLWALLGVLIVAIILTASTSTAAFSAFNPSWDGASGIQATAEQAGLETSVALSTTTYDDVDAADTTAVVIGPETPYTASELRRIQEFVQNGGTLIIADDFGQGGNQLLRGIGAETRIVGPLLRDPRERGPTTAMPITTVVTNESAFSETDTIMLNHGTILEAANTTVLVESSEFSYLDQDRDNEIDENETLQSYPVVTREELGSGTVITVSDASVFINAMFEQSETDNRAFTTAILSDSQRVIIDGSHTSTAPPLQAALLTLRTTPLLQALLVLVVGLIGWLVPTLIESEGTVLRQSGD